MFPRQMIEGWQTLNYEIKEGAGVLLSSLAQESYVTVLRLDLQCFSVCSLPSAGSVGDG